MAEIFDLAGLVLEVNRLERGVDFYRRILGFAPTRHDEGRGVAEFTLSSGQRLSLWLPITRQANEPRLGRLGARGGSHVHYAFQIPKGSLEKARETLERLGILWQEINLADEGKEPDVGLYFYDPFGHGLELREVGLDPGDPRWPLVAPGTPNPTGLPIVGLREVALVFQDFEGAKSGLPEGYGFVFVEEMKERAFAQFVLGPHPEKDGNFTPRRWLYVWDPQVGLADMLGGEHATVQFYADLDRLETRIATTRLNYFRDERGIAVRDPEGHVFEFWPVP